MAEIQRRCSIGWCEPSRYGCRLIRDHRPDLKQIVAQLITSGKSALPVWLEVLSGNSSDKESFPSCVEAYSKQLGADNPLYYVMDSAGYTADCNQW